jgi:hypothetical protein
MPLAAVLLMGIIGGGETSGTGSLSIETLSGWISEAGSLVDALVAGEDAPNSPSSLGSRVRVRLRAG